MVAPLLTALLLHAPPPARVEVEDDLCRYAVVADSDRGSLDEARLRGLLRLGELAGSWIGELHDASSTVAWMDLDAARAAIPRMEAVLARFDAEMARLAPPAAAEPVVRWTRLQMEFDLWQARAELDWCVTKEPAVLRRTFRDVDPATSCAAQIESVTSRWFGKCKAGAFEWGNCVNAAFDERHGRAFPRAAWEAFLKATRIRLEKVECDEP